MADRPRWADFVSLYEQSEDDVVRGIIRVTIGEQEYLLPTLKIEASETWQELARVKLGQAFALIDDPRNFLSLGGLSGITSATMLELVVAYDQERVFGTEAELKQLLDRAQLYGILKALVKAEFPILRDAGALAPLIREQLPRLMSIAERWVLVRSMSGRSPTGASTPAPSEIDSPSDSSTSSGDEARSEPSARPSSSSSSSKPASARATSKLRSLPASGSAGAASAAAATTPLASPTAV